MNGILKLDGVSKEYNFRPILEDVNLVLEPGISYALTAPNGSGKSTLLQLMAGLTRPTSGTVTWNGSRLNAASRAQLGVLLQQPMLYGDLTGFSNLLYYARLYGLRQARSVATDWLERLGLADYAEVKIREYSKGMRQRLALARCLLHNPALLLLDEPFDGLDVASRSFFGGLFEAAQQEGKTLFLVTHHAEEVGLVQRQLTLRFGRVIES